eukprot:3991996-Pyramimonas_sp.AAC.1
MPWMRRQAAQAPRGADAAPPVPAVDNCIDPRGTHDIEATCLDAKHTDRGSAMQPFRSRTSATPIPPTSTCLSGAQAQPRTAGQRLHRARGKAIQPFRATNVKHP